MLTINRALGDPRVAAWRTDAQAHTLRVAIQQLYEATSAKLNELSVASRAIVAASEPLPRLRREVLAHRLSAY